MQVIEPVKYWIMPILFDNQVTRVKKNKVKHDPNMYSYNFLPPYEKDGYIYSSGHNGKRKALWKTKEFRIKLALALSLVCNIILLLQAN